MKCPKCGYIGFESSVRCKNCGYDFSLAPDPEPERSDQVPEPFSLEELDRLDERLLASRKRGAVTPEDLDQILFASEPPAADLPLFVDDGPAEGLEPLRVAAPVRPPLGVRRATPPAPRMRPRGPSAVRPEPADLGLELDVASHSSATPEPERRWDLPLAGGGRRLLAAVVDLAILGALNAAVIYLTLRICSLTFADLGLIASVPMGAFLFLLTAGYLVAFTTVGGQTIGKMAAGIRVVDEDGGPVVLGQAFVRTLAYAASILPAGVGFVPAFLGQARRAVHDRIANTQVVRL